MATWLSHLRLQFGGSLGGGIEEWSNTVRFKSNVNRAGNIGSVAFTGSQLEAAMDDILAPLSAWFSRSASWINAPCTMTWLKLNMIGVDGKQQEQLTHMREFPAVNGGGSGPIPPFFQTLAITHRTLYKRGRAHSGRIFPPLISCPVATTEGYISAANADGIASSWATALNEISDALDANAPQPGQSSVYPVVAAPATAVGPDPGGPLLLPVLNVVVDRVHDVQHRRTNRIPRNESAAAAITA